MTCLSSVGDYRPARRTLRLAFASLVLLSVATMAHGAMTGLSTGSETAVPTAEPRENVTVVSESARYGTLIAWAPNGSVRYYADEHTKYFDVDPVPGTSMTVEYVATDTIHARGPNCADPPCARNVVERTNLSTGETTEVYSRYVRRERAGEWHDHVRVDDRRLLIADIVNDRVYLVDTTTGLVEWSWDARSAFPVSGGGPFPGNWAHINDVSLLPDGRVMVSLRNQDQVVFVDPETGLQSAWTLGSENEYDTLYEQHNPDYIPAERGGPAVVAADSENGRVVEYQRANGEWLRSWSWRDDRLQWPRDADRLPNGHTLVADTHGKRVLEVGRDGEIVWSVPVSHPYDVERLGTGDESAGGASATRLGLDSRAGERAADDDSPLLTLLADAVTVVVPSRVVNAIIYLGPTWMGRVEFAALGLAVLTALAWLCCEFRWRGPALRLRWPVVRREE